MYILASDLVRRDIAMHI